MLVVVAFIPFATAQNKAQLPQELARVDKPSEALFSTEGLSPSSAFLMYDLLFGKLTDREIKEKYHFVEVNGAVEIPAFVRMDGDAVEQQLAEYGVRVKHRYGDLLTVQIPLSRFIELAKSKLCKNIDVGTVAEPALDNARSSTGLNTIYNNSFLGQGLDGTGVVVGIIDCGFEYGHPAFYDSTGTTLRIKRVWDQDATGTPPSGYDYGNELTSTDAILAAQYSHRDTSHGTHVAGIAAGGGGSNNTRRKYRGVAPNADIVLVSTPRTSAAIFDGINYIKDYAASVNKPCVINISIGGHEGPHDGTSDFDLSCDRIISETPRGLLLVGSASNYGNKKIHISKTISDSDNLTTFLNLYDASYGDRAVYIVGSPDVIFEVRVCIFNVVDGTIDTISGYYSSASDSFGTIDLTDGNGQLMQARVYTGTLLGDDTRIGMPGSGRQAVEVLIRNLYHTSGNYRVGLVISSGMSNEIHAWGMNCTFSDGGYSWATAGNTEYTVGEIGGTGNSIISVGSYVTRTSWNPLDGNPFNSRTCSHAPTTIGNLSEFSSHGPTVDGRIKPLITAPGEAVVAPINRFDNNYDFGGGFFSYLVDRTLFHWNYEYYGAKCGTSMSAPFVTGLMTLCLQANPNLTYAQAIRLLQNSALTDGHTGDIGPNGDNRWGWGKVNVRGMIDSVCIVAPPYTEDFEGNTSCWMREGTDGTNQWVIGATVNHGDGDGHALYISRDGGTTDGYSVSSASSVYAYRLLSLEAGNYTVSFDWKANGERDYDYLRAALVPVSTPLSTIEFGNYSVPSEGYIPIDGGSQLVDNLIWTTQTATVNIPMTGEYNLVFYWRNNNRRGNNPGAAIDNIHIEAAPPIDVLTVSACNSYTWHETTYTESGDYTYTYTDDNGDPQSDVLHLTINHPEHTATTATAGWRYTWYGLDYYYSGDYMHSLTDDNGCTQVDTLHLTITNPVDNVVEYWFDQQYDIRQTAVATSTGWQGQIDVSSLDVGLHTLYIHLRDNEGRCSPPRSAQFYRGIDSSMTYTCWFDQNYASRQTLHIADTNMQVDVNWLSDGLHTLNMQIGEGALAELHSYVFLKMPFEGSSDRIYTCWFDRDYDSRVSGRFHNGTLLLNVGNLSDGLHTLNMQIAKGSTAELRSFIFFKMPFEGSSDLVYTCWFDRDYDNRVSGELTTGTLLLNTGNLTDGLHTLNMQTGSGASAELRSYVFYKVPCNAALSDTSTLVYRYAIDGVLKPTLQVTPQNRMIHMDLDVDNTGAGLHSLVGCLMTSDGTSMALHQAWFYSVPAGGEGISRYEYWINDDFDNRTVVDVTPFVDTLQVITLLQVDTMPINTNHFEFVPNGGTPIIRSRNNITFRFWNSALRLTSATRQYVDRRVVETVLADTLERDTTKYFATPGTGQIHWFKLESGVGDSLSFHTNRRCTMQLYSPSGEMVLHASGDSVLTWKGCRVWEYGVCYLAIHDAEGSGNMSVSYDFYEGLHCNSTTYVTACDSYTWNDETYTSSGTYVYHTTGHDDCDSVATLHLTIHTATSGTEYITACDSYTWHYNTFTTSGTRTYHTTNINGCDSLATLHLTINHSTSSSETLTTCDSYTWHGTTYTATATPTYTTTNAVGCDSVVTLNLTIIYSDTVSETVTACDSYSWHGNTYTSSTSSPTYSTTNVAGCDSTVTLHLTVNYSTANTETVTACESYTWHGTDYTATGTYQYSYINDDGCPSTDTLHLDISIHDDTTFYATACDSYMWNGQTYTSSGMYTFDHTAANSSCTNVDTLYLTIGYSNAGIDRQVACDAFTWHGVVYTASTNTPTYTLENVAGCDSVVTLDLTINYSDTTVVSVTACDSFAWHGTAYTSSTSTPTYLTSNIAGCDSTVTLHLTVNHRSAGTEAVSACDNYTWHGITYTASAMPTYTTTNAVGCDSTVTLHLTVNYSDFDTVTVSACDNYTWHDSTFTASTSNFLFSTLNSYGCDSTIALNLTVNYGTHNSYHHDACEVYTWHGVDYTASGTYQYAYMNSYGCPSTDTLHLNINTHDDTAYHVVACDSYYWNGETYTSSGIYIYDHTQSSSACTNVDTLYLTLNHSTTATETITACDSFIWHGNTYTASTQIPTYTTQNVVGCDSTVTLHLTINNSTAGTVSVTTCDSYMWNGTVLYTASAVDTITTTNAQGCDSVTTLYLTVNYSNAGTETITACDSFAWHGTVYTASTNTPTFVSTNAAGCDSTVTLLLSINYSNTGDTMATACDSYTWWNTNYTSSTNVATHVLSNMAGCDSTVTLHLTVNYSSAASESITACDSLSWNGTVYTASTVDSVTATNAQGCDSVITLYLTINYSSAATESVTACDSITWIDGNTYTASTNEPTVTIANHSDCDSVITLNLTINYSSRDTIVDSAAGSYEWQGNTYTESGMYTFEGQTEAGCDSVIVLMLSITDVGITAVDSLGNVRLFPNPTTGKITVVADGVAKIEVFDQYGRIVATFHESNVIDIHHLPTGAYTLRITLHDGSRGETLLPFGRDGSRRETLLPFGRDGSAIKRVVKQ